MTARKLPNDVARCSGEVNDADEWRKGCEDCLRRTDRSTFPLQNWMAPPPLVDGECQKRKAPSPAQPLRWHRVCPSSQPAQSAR